MYFIQFEKTQMDTGRVKDWILFLDQVWVQVTKNFSRF